MHHASFPYPQDSRVFGSSNNATLVTGSVKGVLLKSKCPSKCACTETYGYCHDEQSKFNVIFTCFIKWYHKCRENVGCVDDNPDIK